MELRSLFSMETLIKSSYPQKTLMEHTDLQQIWIGKCRFTAQIRKGNKRRRYLKKMLGGGPVWEEEKEQ